jgi:hypothetical protein
MLFLFFTERCYSSTGKSLSLNFSLSFSPLPITTGWIFFSINSLFGPDSSVKEFFCKFLYNLKETKMQIAHKVYDEMPQPLFSSVAFFLLEKKNVRCDART